MSIRNPSIPLVVLALLLAWAVPAGAETAASLSCAAGASPPAEIAFGAPDRQLAKPCPFCAIEFCAKVAIRCTFTGCGLNNCCAYSCVCDSSCNIPNTPGNTCRFLLPNCLFGNDVAELDEGRDGTDLRGETCVSRGFQDGTPACNQNCTFDTSGCSE